MNVIAYRSPLLKLPHFRSEQIRAKRSSFVSMWNPSRTGSPNGLQSVTSGMEFPYAQADTGNHGAKIREKDGKAKGFRRIFWLSAVFFAYLLRFAGKSDAKEKTKLPVSVYLKWHIWENSMGWNSLFHGVERFVPWGGTFLKVLHWRPKVPHCRTESATFADTKVLHLLTQKCHICKFLATLATIMPRVTLWLSTCVASVAFLQEK